jgi:hypothetical protein
VTFKENGNVSAESLKAMLVKGRMNYVVMETGIPDDQNNSRGKFNVRVSVAVSDFRAK